MLGDKLGDLTGKVTVRRVLPSRGGGPILEVSAEQTGVILGVQAQGYVTYEAAFRPDGKVDGSGRGVLMGAGGEMATWTATGLGVFKEDGVVRFTGSINYLTTSPTWAQLNDSAGVFEWEEKPDGSSQATFLGWK